MECSNVCKSEPKREQEESEQSQSKLKGLSELCLENGILVKCNKKEQTSSCLFDNHEYQHNSTWSPIPCTKCKCENTVTKCFVIECPKLDCQYVSDIIRN